MPANMLLQQIGLSDKEAILYEALLRFGAQPAGTLAKRAGLNRATTYNVLATLIAKGLAAKTTRKDNTYFSALEPQYLLSYLDRQRLAIEKQKTLLQHALPQFYQLLNPQSLKPQTRYFEGREGVRTLIEDTLTIKEPPLRGILSIQDLTEVLGEEYFDDYIARRIKKGITLQVLRTTAKDLPPKYPSSNKELREFRQLPKGMTFDLSMYIYDHKVALISSQEEGFGLLIESREFANMQKTFFLTLWQGDRA